MRYGRDSCEHDLVYRSDGWEEGCGGIVCIECGAFGCFCDLPDPKPEKTLFFARGVDGDANVNGYWINPYVKQHEFVEGLLNMEVE